MKQSGLPQMRRSVCLLMTLVGLAAALQAQECPQELRGAWRGILPSRQLFEVRIAVREPAAGVLVAEFRSGKLSEPVQVWKDGPRLRFQGAKLPLAFDGRLSEDGSKIGGFVYHASAITRIEVPIVPGSQPRTWETDWSPLAVPEENLRIDLYIGDDGTGSIGGFWFFRDQRLPALWGYGLECRGDMIRLGEKNLGLDFEGQFDPQADVLKLTVKRPGTSVPVTFDRMAQELAPALPDAPEAPARPPRKTGYVERQPEAVNDGWQTSKPSDVGIDPDKIEEMIKAVVEGEMALTHSVLVARQGKLAVEEYFYGFDRETLHDMRSASKTIASTLIGLAIRDDLIPGVHAAALSFFPDHRHYANWDPRKARITVRDLLTMSSGLDANDSNPDSAAAEGAYQSQTKQPDWIKLALDAPMINDPGAQPLYGGANPLILGGILAQAVNRPVEWFAHQELFGPLGIENYKFFLDPTGVVYMGGGMHMRPRDMLKYGQLYLTGGLWQDRRILPEDWIKESWKQYGRLAPLERNGHQYGYLWWHHQYEVGRRAIETLEARGNGGQYIFVVPTLDMVVVVTAGNFRTGKTRQPEELIRRFILPAVQQPPDVR